MTFFNKKEEVIEVQLTPYGRKLLSQGKLKPEYYAFFDDDILYDSQKAGFSENNSESKTRILTETPSTRPVVANFGVETGINTNYSDILDTFMPLPIGHSNPVDSKSAGWNIVSLDKEVDTYSLTSSLSSNRPEVKGSTTILNIPQINCKLEFTMSIDTFSSFTGDFESLANPFDIYQSEDDRFLKVEKENFVFYFMEKNGFLNRDSYETEVYIFEEDEGDFKKLHFANPQKEIVNDLLSEDEQEMTTNLTPDHVEYYLELLLDDEIPDSEICVGLDKLKESNVYLDLDLKCPDRDQLISIYSSTIGDIEECD